MFTKATAEAYFNAEKTESLLFIIVGLLAILLAVVLMVVYKTPFYKGLAVPLVIIGIVQLAAGKTVYSRSDAQRKDIVYKMDMDPASLQEKELPRMETVMRNFTIYRYVEIALLLTGLVVFFATKKNPAQSFWTGLALGLAIQAALLLVADGIAEKRGRAYLQGIRGLSQPARSLRGREVRGTSTD